MWRVAVLLAACGVAPPPRVEPAPPARTVARAPIAAGERVFVRRTTPISIDGPEGPIVGRAFAGARLSVVEVQGEWAAVLLDEDVFGPRWRTLEDGSQQADDFVVLVPLDAIGRDHVELALPVLEGRLAVGFDWHLSPTPGGPGFAGLRCGLFRIVEERTEAGVLHRRVAQENDGVELVGWADGPIEGPRGWSHCPPRTLFLDPEATETPEVPEGLVLPPREALERELRSVLRRGVSIHVLRDGEDGASCRRMELDSTDRLVSEPLVQQQDGRQVRVRSSYYFDRHGTAIELLGPRYEPLGTGGRGVSIVNCESHREVVEIHADRIALVPGAWRRSVHAYHPDDVELWFRSREACERAAAVRNATPITPASLTTLAQAWGGC